MSSEGLTLDGTDGSVLQKQVALMHDQSFCTFCNESGPGRPQQAALWLHGGIVCDVRANRNALPGVFSAVTVRLHNSSLGRFAGVPGVAGTSLAEGAPNASSSRDAAQAQDTIHTSNGYVCLHWRLAAIVHLRVSLYSGQVL